jgi:Uma2 family endonuclease
MSRDEYCAWLREQTARYERIDGEVVAMAPERAVHLRLKRDVLLALIATCPAGCEVLPDGATVETEDGDYEPDAVVNCGARMADDATVAPNPVVVVEVLSPSTRGGDLNRKLVGYFKVASIQHYLILFPDRPQVIHHRRHGGQVLTSIHTTGAISLDPPGISLSLDKIYHR